MTSNPAQDNLPSWSRDGRWIYFHSNRTGSYQIWRMSAAGTSEQEAPIQVTRNGGTHPLESPDSKSVYYFRSNGLWQVPAEGGEETQVIRSVRNVLSFEVTARGIYFIPRDEAIVQFLDFKTRATRTVATLDQSMFGDLAVSPDGRSILYSQIDSQGSDLMLVENFR